MIRKKSSDSVVVVVPTLPRHLDKTKSVTACFSKTGLKTGVSSVKES